MQQFIPLTTPSLVLSFSTHQDLPFSTYKSVSNNTSTPSTSGALKIIQLENGHKTLGDKNGVPVQLRGMSTHGLQWYPGILNDNAFDALSRDWKANVIRLAMYISEGGYAHNAELEQKVIEGINLAKKYDLYAIVDWHVTIPGNPAAPIYNGAFDFFKRISSVFPNDPHLLYELVNEPSPASTKGYRGITNDHEGWEEVKRYAVPIIEMLRSNGHQNIIIIGTPNWSQRPDLAANSPIEDGNTMYASHFYTGTHLPKAGEADRTNVMNNIEYARKSGVPVFVTEFGTSKADGDGGPYLDNAEKWLNYLDKHNISWCNWSLTNKDEASAAFLPCTRLDPGHEQAWDLKQLTLSGKFMRSRMQRRNYRGI